MSTGRSRMLIVARSSGSLAPEWFWRSEGAVIVCLIRTACRRGISRPVEVHG